MFIHSTPGCVTSLMIGLLNNFSGLHQKFPSEGSQEDSHRWEALPVRLEGLRLALCAQRRADPPPAQAHRRPALSVQALWARLQPVRSSGAAHEATSLFVILKEIAIQYLFKWTVATGRKSRDTVPFMERWDHWALEATFLCAVIYILLYILLYYYVSLIKC